VWTTYPGILCPFNTFSILLNLKKYLPQPFTNIKLRNKDKTRNTNLRHQIQTQFCHFVAVCLPVVSLRESSVVAIWQSDFCLFKLIKILSDCLAIPWEQYKLAQVLNSNLTQWRTQKIFMEGGICIWCALFVTSQFDLIFMFLKSKPTFGEVCWHNMHIRLHAFPLFYVSLHWK